MKIDNPVQGFELVTSTCITTGAIYMNDDNIYLLILVLKIHCKVPRCSLVTEDFNRYSQSSKGFSNLIMVKRAIEST